MRLYEPIHPAFERFCRARVYGEMEHGDLINEVLLKALPKIDELKAENALLSYLCSIAIRILANSHRKKRPRNMDLQRATHVHPLSDPVVEQKLEVDRLYAAMAQLPVEQKESLILYEINGFSIKEVAKMHGVGESAVKQRLRRGRMALAEILREEKPVEMTESNRT